MKKFVKHPIHANSIPMLQRRIFTPGDLGDFLRQIKQLQGCSISVCETPDQNSIDFIIDDDVYTAVIDK